ncbi:hypothetical protein V5O48_002518 [Marasmius crinis-equi]|uniref:T6SS Phospholipase effector Tle1-like catalytic domain-containing protein n=1 Tax=Marasmius crinis-equi TaxID=585013 RepID=A0ABR3FVD9_9AGAR
MAPSFLQSWIPGSPLRFLTARPAVSDAHHSSQDGLDPAKRPPTPPPLKEENPSRSPASTSTLSRQQSFLLNSHKLSPSPEASPEPKTSDQGHGEGQPFCSVQEHNNSCGDHQSRNLVICIDGTSNKFSSTNTNVVELYSRLQKDTTQLTYYDSGIGTYPVPSHKNTKYYLGLLGHRLDLMFAFRFQSTIIKAYEWLSEYYRPNDRIYLIVRRRFMGDKYREGFSRGAYQARVLAAMIEKVGLIHKGNQGQIPFAYELYYRSKKHTSSLRTPKTGHSGAETSAKLPHLDSPARLSVERGAEEPALQFKRTFSRNVKVHFVGAWDTVSSVGVMRSENLPMTVDGMQYVCYFRHALALDERRVKFLPDYACGGGSPVSHSGKDSSKPHTKEVWFVGTHSDIGGGNADNAALNNNRPALRWMSQEAERAGLRVDDLFVGSSTNDPTMKDGAIKESLVGFWRVLEYLPLRRLAYADSGLARSTAAKRSYDDDNRTTRRLHLGERRIILPGQLIHESVYSTKKALELPEGYQDPSIYEHVELDETPGIAFEFSTYFQTLTLLHNKRVYQSIQIPSSDQASKNELEAVMAKFRMMADKREGKLQFQDLIHKLYASFDKVDSPKQQCDTSGAMDALIAAGAKLFQVNAPRRLPPVLSDMMKPRRTEDLQRLAKKFLETFGTGEVFTVPEVGPVCVSISSDGNQVVYLVRDSGKVRVVDTVATFKPSSSEPGLWRPQKSRLKLPPSIEEASGVRCAMISPNGKLAAVGYGEPRDHRKLVVFDLTDLTKPSRVVLKSHEKDSILDVRFSFDSQRVYYATAGPGGHTLWSWKVEFHDSGQDVTVVEDDPKHEVKSFMGPGKNITTFGVSRNSTMVAAASEDGHLRVWDTRTVNRYNSQPFFIEYDVKVRALSFPSNDCFYTAGDDGTICRWRSSGPGNHFAKKELKKTNASINALATGFSETRLVCGFDDASGTVEVYDVSDGGFEMVGEPMHHQSSIYSLSYAADGDCLVAGTRYNGGVTFWDENGPTGERIIKHVSTNDHYFFK